MLNAKLLNTSPLPYSTPADIPGIQLNIFIYFLPRFV